MTYYQWWLFHVMGTTHTVSGQIALLTLIVLFAVVSLRFLDSDNLYESDFQVILRLGSVIFCSAVGLYIICPDQETIDLMIKAIESSK